MSPLQQLVLCLLLCLIAAFLIPGVQPYMENTLKCEPSTPFLGSKVTVILYLEHIEYPSKCTFSTNGQVMFGSGKNKARNQETQCSVTDIRRSSCSWPRGELGCGCVANTSKHYIVQYNFITRRDDGVIWYSGTINCITKGYTPAIVYQPCYTEVIPLDMSKNTMATISPGTWTMAGSITAVLLVTLQ